MDVIRSSDNPLVKALRKLAQDGSGYRDRGQIWVEGEHLCMAAAASGWQAELAVLSESFVARAQMLLAPEAIKTVVIADRLFSALSALKSPAGCGVLLRLPAAPSIAPGLASVVLDRLQDAGNVGSILRSAAAFGFGQVIALKGTVALWSPKVLRAGMGAHFGLRLVEGTMPSDLDALALPLLSTSSHQGEWLHQARLPPAPHAWMFGHEGGGIGEELAARASGSMRIAQPGGEESLNVAAAAAICLHASAAARAARALTDRPLG